MAGPTTKPGDIIGQDSAGRIRIDRVIPLPWVLGMLVAVVAQAVTLWMQVQGTTDTVRRIDTRLEAIVSWQSTSQIADAEFRSEVRELRRRVEQLEVRADGRAR